MPKVNYDKMTYAELLEMEIELALVLEERREAELEDIRAKVAEMAEASGFSIDEVTNKRRSSRRGKKVAIKYADGNGNNWTGRGRQPRWVVDAIAGGATLESLEVSE